MNGENPSTTNTARREVVLIPREPPSVVISAMQQAHSIYTHGCKMSRAYSAAFEYFATLTQQQGGEQEVRELLGEPWHEEISGMVRGNPLFDGQQQWVRLEDATAALRSKPAASEGDVAEKEFFSRDFYEDAKEGKVAWPVDK